MSQVHIQVLGELTVAKRRLDNARRLAENLDVTLKHELAQLQCGLEMQIEAFARKNKLSRASCSNLEQH